VQKIPERDEGKILRKESESLHEDRPMDNKI
jgi:hypothetical protein